MTLKVTTRDLRTLDKLGLEGFVKKLGIDLRSL